MRFPFVFIVLCALLVPASAARAWNYTGHRAIATIAYDELKPEVRAKVDAILRAHPRYEKDLLGDIPDGYAQRERFAFAMSGYWPDIIRNPANPMHFTNHRPQWHYIEYPFRLADWTPATGPTAGSTTQRTTGPVTQPTTGVTTGPATRPTIGSASRPSTGASARLGARFPGTRPGTRPATQPALDGALDGAKDVIEAIAKNRAVLGDPSLADAKKAVAICWLVHLVGDLHQPLHATTLFSAQFPDGDQGGNRFMVNLRRQNMNLHAVWDGMLGLQTSPAMIDYLAAGIRNDPRFARTAMPETKAGDPNVWKHESHELGVTVAYLNGTLTGASSEDIGRDPAVEVPSLPEGYLRDGEAVAARRAALAGHRLADLLNATLSE